MITTQGKVVVLLSAACLVVFLILADRYFNPKPLPNPSHGGPPISSGQAIHREIQTELKRGSFTVVQYPAKLGGSLKTPKALILFESGGGGLCWWEDKVCTYLQTNGYEVLAIDARVYSLTDYDIDTLQTDYQTLAQLGMKPYGDNSLPLIIGGWSTGAEQAVAVGGGPHRPAGLTGLLLIAPGSWGGYGWYASHDYGPRLVRRHTFALRDFATKLNGLRIAQWHASFDILDSRSWLKSLQAPHKEYDLSNSIHDFGGVSDEFLAGLNQSLAWILNTEPDTVPTKDLSPH